MPTEDHALRRASQPLGHCSRYLLQVDGRTWLQWAAAHVRCRATRQVLARHYSRRQVLAAPVVAGLFAALAALHACGALIGDALAGDARPQAAPAERAAVQAHLRGTVLLAARLRDKPRQNAGPKRPIGKTFFKNNPGNALALTAAAGAV